MWAGFFNWLDEMTFVLADLWSFLTTPLNGDNSADFINFATTPLFILTAGSLATALVMKVIHMLNPLT